MTPAFACPICARTFHTALFASLHRATFHQPEPSPAVQQFERVLRDQWDAAMNALPVYPADVEAAPWLPGDWRDAHDQREGAEERRG